MRVIARARASIWAARATISTRSASRSGMLWLPSLRRADPRWLAAFMALTGGLLTFLAVDALFEALELQAALPGALGGPGLVLLGAPVSYLGLSWVAQRLARRGSTSAVSAPLAGLALATMVATGIGLHDLGEGLAIGSSFALGQLALGSFLIMGFMVHNVTEGLGIAAPIAEGRWVGPRHLAGLTLIAGAPAILGAWIGGFLTNEILAVLFFAIAVGAAAQVVVEVGRHIARRAPGGLGSGWVVGGLLAGGDHVPDRPVHGLTPGAAGPPGPTDPPELTSRSALGATASALAS